MNRELQAALDKLRAMKATCGDDPQRMLQKYEALVSKLERIVPGIVERCSDAEKEDILRFIHAVKSDCVELICKI